MFTNQDHILHAEFVKQYDFLFNNKSFAEFKNKYYEYFWNEPSTPENIAAIRSRVLSSFVTQARSRGTPLPAEIQLWKGLIHQHDQGYSESFEQEAAVSTAAPSTP